MEMLSNIFEMAAESNLSERIYLGKQECKAHFRSQKHSFHGQYNAKNMLSAIMHSMQHVVLYKGV